MQVKIEVPKDVVNRVSKAVTVGKNNIVASWLYDTQPQMIAEIVAAINEHTEGKQRKKRLKALGFDLSTKSRVKCSQCEVLVIYGTPCHEHGCPNIC